MHEGCGIRLLLELKLYYRMADGADVRTETSRFRLVVLEFGREAVRLLRPERRRDDAASLSSSKSSSSCQKGPLYLTHVS